ncbi:MAG: DedA family protein [Hyphomonas sp.]|uniref:YqaA family protein n=1 Tax=Hyphomonas sp. TaxID=87 RepID=UPI001818CEA6|nr:YqaA family protein [Hyphomonas sp.]MBU3920951.1 DedA family protein [Alphaproteobacteria bacterium]MBA3068626.1 DedA family protein [Hyphomonas sp.]MBU4061945.1 DedA family protein [Alphaproteobacteria bacterium]MBU4166100.1 DedA family protein [Alphaproteobacteria bacterium]MBU4568680.1 DedA family protein [Alphaproteobacteria bacterium]
MFQKTMDWTLSLASRKSAEVWLGIVAFVESSFFFLPAELLFLPMALARPERAYWLALIASVGSVLGGMAGYYIGAVAFNELAAPLLVAMGKMNAFEQMKACTGDDTMVTLLLTSSLTHIPPMKVVTILAGAANVSFALFVATCVVARGGRFLALAWALNTYGEDIRHFIEKRLGLIAAIGGGLLIAAYIAYKLLFSHGITAC